MAAIQAIHIRGHETRPEPKPHTVYRIEIQAHVRSWQMWRRYSEFAELHTELTKSTGSPPAALPPKHSFSIIRTFSREQKIIEERREGLELYLRAIISAKEDKWRDSIAFREFIGVPVGRHAEGGGESSSGNGQFSSSSWLDEHHELQNRLRDVRAEINKRDALSDRGDIGASHTAGVQAKKKLAEILSRVRTLTQGLQALAMHGMAEGELQRRTDMVARIQDDCEKLGKMVTVSRQMSRGLTVDSGSGKTFPAPESDRAALLGPPSRQVTRVFGAAAQETEQTRPLDDTGVLQLQQVQMTQQDNQLAQLTTMLQRQRHLGEAINSELATQIELLDDLNNDVDRVGGKLSSAKKQMNRLG
ncbi:hypothetical protein SERLA73DRAFT_179981 [Serpula lacrymans var. lacrymans S7.3]|uniref:Syntaxin n=1 Tax=Serpula lacrymans var. lacrymans (strain S7.3) TaxID=936435 RepID=F8PV85_SERL3|nr:hypothetical protein SERLA73DRAFT_179981 [Serpula lacrymans var. lacrymans S7.3]